MLASLVAHVQLAAQLALSLKVTANTLSMLTHVSTAAHVQVTAQ